MELSTNSPTTVLESRNINGIDFGYLGVSPVIEQQDVGIFNSAIYSTRLEYEMTLAAVDGIFTLLSPENIRTLLGTYSGQEIPDESRPLSPIGLAQAGSQIADNGYVNLFSLLAFVNVFLAVFNAIPLIPLDGGRVLLSLIEGITGKKIPIFAVLGDQQAAAVGQACFEKGSIKTTYGTGAFVMMNTGSSKIHSKNKLLTTICYRLNGKNTYALEGSIFIAGAGVQWLRDKIKLINNAYETETIAKSTKTNNGVYVVPAFSGIGAPYWRSDARGLITGLTRDSDWKTLVRATVESVAYQSYDLFRSMSKDGLKPKIIKIDGGMVANNWFSQFLSDIIDLQVIRPKVLETTALGVAVFAGYKSGVFKSLKEITSLWKKDRDFKPKISKANRNYLIKGWNLAIKRTLV